MSHMRPKVEPPPLFAGLTYDPAFDAERLTGQLRRVYDLVKDGRPRTLSEIRNVTGGSEAAISARLRDLRKEQYGSHMVHRERVGDPHGGLWRYWMEGEIKRHD